MRLRWFFSSITVCFVFLVLEAQAVTVGGREYEQVGSTWFFVDSYGESWEIRHGLIEVKFGGLVTEGQRDSLAAVYDLSATGPDPNPFQGYYRFTYGPEEDPIDLLNEVIACSMVDDADIPWKTKPLGDPYFTFDKQWNSYLIALDRALSVPPGSTEVLLAIHDFGVDRDHEDLLATVWNNPNEIDNGEDDDNDDAWRPSGLGIPDDFWGWDFDSEHDPVPLLAHGTLVAGMAVAANDNEKGVASPGGGNSTERPVRWLAVVGTNAFTMRDAFFYCHYKGVDVINVSFTFPEDDARAVAGLEEFIDGGGLIVAAAGNGCEESVGPVAFPARHDSVLAVGAVDSLLAHWDYSCAGGAVDLVAPAGYKDLGMANVAYHWSTDNYCDGCPEFNPGTCDCTGRVTDAAYTLSGGTSSAAPQVAGVAALVWSQRPELTAAEVKAVLRRSARDLGPTGPDDE